MPRTPTPPFAARRRGIVSSFRIRSRQHPTDFFRSQPPNPRHFAHQSSLFLVSRSPLRPQIPFLHPTSRSNTAAAKFQTQLARFISTERKARWKAQLRWQLRFHAYFWPSAALLVVLIMGIQQTKFEHDYPTPREWTFWSRWYSRTARYTELDKKAKVQRVLTDWERAGYYYRLLLERLEEDKYDGKHLIEQGEGGILVEGVGRTGFDVSAKSEPWRRGYFEALIGAARTAEHLDGIAKKKDTVRGPLYPWESIPGPNNLRPKPLPWDKRGQYLHPPREEECENAFANPEVYYMRILTTKGFTNRQRLEAALGFADWCDFKGLPDTASNMYDWALDIAAGGLPDGANNVVDMRTGIINSGKEEFVSENLLKATTALGVHHARNGEVKQALPIFLSILRARRALPATRPESQQQYRKSNDDQYWMLDYLFAFKDYITDAPYPRAPTSGDERPHHSLKEACEEVGLMTYIGEILFATSESEKEKGLSWTRDSVEAAEAVLWVMDEQGTEEETEGRMRCRECLQAGLQNWKEMAQQMARLARNKEEQAKQSKGWLGLGIGQSSALEKAINEVNRWDEEEAQIELRKQKTTTLINPLKPWGSSWASA